MEMKAADEEFQELVDLHYEALYRFALSMSKNREVAADLVQQTYCIWAEKGAQLKDKSKAKSWLFTTLYREQLAQVRKGKRQSDEDFDTVVSRVEAESPDTERQMDGQRVLDLLGELEESYRAPLTLFYLQQHSYKEIAAILDVPIGTVMSRISRGKQQLRSRMVSEPSSAPKNLVQVDPNAFKKGVANG